MDQIPKRLVLLLMDESAVAAFNKDREELAKCVGSYSAWRFHKPPLGRVPIEDDVDAFKSLVTVVGNTNVVAFQRHYVVCADYSKPWPIGFLINLQRKIGQSGDFSPHFANTYSRDLHKVFEHINNQQQEDNHD